MKTKLTPAFPSNICHSLWAKSFPNKSASHKVSKTTPAQTNFLHYKLGRFKEQESNVCYKRYNLSHCYSNVSKNCKQHNKDNKYLNME